ncbi:MAG: TRAP transporter small permease [Candidatus Eiseniibacteriota bacterium]
MEPEEAPGTLPATGRLSWLDRTLLVIVATIMFAMMALTFVDVFMRYLFASPIPGAFEIIQFMMALVIFCALPVVTRKEVHITVGLFEGFMVGRVGWIRRLGVLLFSAGVVTLLAYQMWMQGIQLQEGQHITGFLEVPVAPIAYAMSVLSWVTLIVLIGMIWRHLRGTPGRPA